LLSPEIIGRIILSKFLSLSLKNYKNIIKELENSHIFRLSSTEIINFKPFPQAKTTNNFKGFTQNILAKIERNSEGFHIFYSFPGFAGQYSFNQEKLTKLIETGCLPNFPEYQINLLSRRLRLINTRNKITYMILMGIIEHQTAYLKSCNPLDLKPLNRVKLSTWIKNNGYKIIDHSIISRVVNGTYILLPNGKKIPLRNLFPTRREIHKEFIKELLRREERELKLNRLNRPYSDEKLQKLLKKEYGIIISRRSVSYGRKLIGAPSSYRRNKKDKYPPKWVNFSSYFPLSATSIKINAPEGAGIYELSLESSNIEYPYQPTKIFYIGCSQNIRKRLRSYLGSSTKNKDLSYYIKGYKCLFRFIPSDNGYREKEKALLQNFIKSYGTRPKCNKIG